MRASGRLTTTCGVALAAWLALGSVVRADGAAGAGEDGWLDEAPDAGLYPAQREEWLLSVSSLNTWNPESGHYDRGFGAGIEVAFPLDVARRTRIGVHGGFLIGAFGGDDYPPVSLVPGLRFRWSPFLYDEYDLYALAKLDTAVGLDSTVQVALRPGLGGGVRIVRTFSLEFAFEPPVALRRDFQAGGTASGWLVGLWTSGAFDLCVFGGHCRAPAPRPTHVDATCVLYRRASSTCRAVSGGETHAPLCRAVEAALDAGGHPPRQNEDSTTAFLVALDVELRKDEALDAAARYALLAEVWSLVQTHTEHRRALLASRDAARDAARAGRVLAREVRYAPYVVEVARALGCYEAALGLCPDVCER